MRAADLDSVYICPFSKQGNPTDLQNHHPSASLQTAKARWIGTAECAYGVMLHDDDSRMQKQIMMAIIFAGLVVSWPIINGNKSAQSTPYTKTTFGVV